jgi:hypothetical protein
MPETGFSTCHQMTPEAPEVPRGGFDTRTKPDAFVLELRPLTTGWRYPAEQRLRAALKALLRGYGLRCVSVRPCYQHKGEQRQENE